MSKRTVSGMEIRLSHDNFCEVVAAGIVEVFGYEFKSMNVGVVDEIEGGSGTEYHIKLEREVAE